MAQPALGPRVDWGDALDVPTFYGREGELATLTQWIVQERCRVVSVLGMGASAIRRWRRAPCTSWPTISRS